MEPNQLNLNRLEHHLALQDLVKNTVVPGAFSYTYDRMGDYQAFAKTQGQRFDVFGAFDEAGQLLGATQITSDQVYWNGKSTFISYSGDTRVSEQARGKRLADRLIQAACSPTLPVLGAVLGSNTLVLEKKLGDWSKVGVDFKVVGEVKALLCRTKRFEPTRSWPIRSATANDLNEMHLLWQAEQSEKNLGRFYAGLAEFQKSYQVSGVSLEDTLVIEDPKTGRLLGFVSIWDQSAIRKIRVHRILPMIKKLMPLLRLWIPFPAEGEELKIGYAHQLCLNSKAEKKHEALSALIREARTRAGKKGMLFFSLGFDVRDPLLKTAQKQALVSNSVKMIAVNSKPDDRLFHLEVGLG